MNFLQGDDERYHKLDNAYFKRVNKSGVDVLCITFCETIHSPTCLNHVDSANFSSQ